jgi:hypothetical protein
MHKVYIFFAFPSRKYPNGEIFRLETELQSLKIKSLVHEHLTGLARPQAHSQPAEDLIQHGTYVKNKKFNMNGLLQFK